MVLRTEDGGLSAEVSKQKGAKMALAAHDGKGPLMTQEGQFMTETDMSCGNRRRQAPAYFLEIDEAPYT